MKLPLSLFCVFLVACAPEITHVRAPGRSLVFSVEVADSPSEQQTGLMHREFLADNSGMLFIFNQEKQHTFWMKNTMIPLDIVFIASDMRVVDIVRGAPPCVQDPCPAYTSNSPALYVLEVNAGAADSLYKGDTLDFS